VPGVAGQAGLSQHALGTTALAAVAPAAVLVAPALPAGAQAEAPLPGGDLGRGLGREVLGADDGWAAEGAGTTGGAAADDAHVFTVRTWAQLAAALDGGSSVPKIIYVRGTIDANTDAQGRPLSCADYAIDGYTTQKYLAAYDPRTWGGQKPSGPQEEARAASAARQAERVELAVGSNTTLVGVGRDAVLKGAGLQVKDASNVIVRNLELRDAYDCFPVWQPNTGGLGVPQLPLGGAPWKTAYDNIWLRGASHVWVDHVTISDKGHPDAAEPTYFGRNYLRHDGLLDNGNSDTATGDRGKLRVTLHHNSLKGVVQRAPRVRFGQVHVYNNAYEVPEGTDHRYSWGVSTESRIYAENNAFTTPGHVEAADLVKSWNGSALHQSGAEFNGYPVDLLAIHNSYNSGSERDLEPDVGWTPALHGRIDGATKAAKDVARGAGAGRIG
jgi:pectate lyase